MEHARGAYGKRHQEPGRLGRQPRFRIDVGALDADPNYGGSGRDTNRDLFVFMTAVLKAIGEVFVQCFVHKNRHKSTPA